MKNLTGYFRQVALKHAEHILEKHGYFVSLLRNKNIEVEGLKMQTKEGSMIIMRLGQVRIILTEERLMAENVTPRVYLGEDAIDKSHTYSAERFFEEIDNFMKGNGGYWVDM